LLDFLIKDLYKKIVEMKIQIVKDKSKNLMVFNLKVWIGDILFYHSKIEQKTILSSMNDTGENLLR